MNQQLRDRGIMPVLIPVGSLIVIGALTFSLGQILLAVPKQVAVAVGIMVAFSVLVTFSVLAVRPRLRSTDIVLMLGAAAVPLALGSAVALGVIEVAGPAEHEEGPLVLEIAAENIEFTKSELTVPAGREFFIDFENRDPDPHNIAIFQGDSPSAPNIFRGEIFTGPAEKRYAVPALQDGSYFFHCDVHPNMTGVVVAQAEEREALTEAEAEEGAEPAPPAKTKVVAEDIEFDKQTLSFSSGTPITIEFENLDTVPHNIAIFKGSSPSGDRVFSGSIFPGPRTETYHVDPLEAGEYYFHCDVHPNMSGTIQID